MNIRRMARLAGLVVAAPALALPLALTAAPGAQAAPPPMPELSLKPIPGPTFMLPPDFVLPEVAPPTTPPADPGAPASPEPSSSAPTKTPKAPKAGGTTPAPEWVGEQAVEALPIAPNQVALLGGLGEPGWFVIRGRNPSGGH